MKGLTHIMAKLLTAYFVALPILFGWHTFQHQHDYSDDHEGLFEYAEFSTDCDLCDLYHSQTATTESFSFFVGHHMMPWAQEDLNQVLVTTSKYPNFHRGPPVA